MARKRRDFTRETLPDPKYDNVLVTKFLNVMMWEGKRSIAEKIFYGSLDLVKDRFKEDGLETFQKALDNVRPLVEVRSRRVGGANYQVPTEVRPKRQNALAIRWLIAAARGRAEKNMKERLANELFEAAQNRGNAVKKREEAHKMAEANRAFAHYRW